MERQRMAVRVNKSKSTWRRKRRTDHGTLVVPKKNFTVAGITLPLLSLKVKKTPSRYVHLPRAPSSLLTLSLVGAGAKGGRKGTRQ